MLYKDSAARAVARRAYVAACGMAAAVNTTVPRHSGIAVFYGGARSGHTGGPLVKVQRLREHFPEARWGYTILYSLSNAPYLPGWALQVLKRRRIAIVHNQNGTFYPAWYAGDWRAENDRMALAYHAADWVFYQSEFCRRASDMFLGARGGPGEILYNAVDTRRFAPAAGARPHNPYRLLITGKIGNHLFYRIDSTIRALHEARRSGLDASLTIAGVVEGEALERGRRLASQLGVDGVVKFTGPYTQQQAPDIYRDADAYVMTKHNDPCPNTVIEALASGLPVIYSNTGGTPELVGDDAGIGAACPEDWQQAHAPSPGDLAAAFTKVAAAHERFAAAARARAVERFDIQPWIARHRAVFERLHQEISRR